MPNCNLTIEFYRPDRTYASGEKINGWIRVNVDRNVRCRGLNLTARWGTGGRGTPALGNYWQETLYRGTWAPGELYEYPFEVPSPGGPFTYHGQNLDLDHFLSVRADLPWTIETRTEKSFRLIPGSLVESSRKNELTVPLGIVPALKKAAAIAGTALLVTGLTLIAFGNWIGVVIAVTAAAVVLFVNRRTLSIWNLNQVHWDLPEAISPGSVCPIRVRAGTGRVTRIRAIELRLQALEFVSAGPQRKRDKFRHEIYLSKSPLDFQSAANGRGGIDFTTNIDVPEIPAWSIDLPGNQVVWRFRLTIQQSWWPDWFETRQIQLIPVADNRITTRAFAGND